MESWNVDQWISIDYSICWWIGWGYQAATCITCDDPSRCQIRHTGHNNGKELSSTHHTLASGWIHVPLSRHRNHGGRVMKQPLQTPRRSCRWTHALVNDYRATKVHPPMPMVQQSLSGPIPISNRLIMAQMEGSRRIGWLGVWEAIYRGIPIVWKHQLFGHKATKIGLKLRYRKKTGCSSFSRVVTSSISIFGCFLQPWAELSHIESGVILFSPQSPPTWRSWFMVWTMNWAWFAGYNCSIYSSWGENL